MKKAQPFILVGATCVVLLAGLWATGLLNTGPRAEKGSPPPEASKKGSEKATPQELILGKWEGEDDGKPVGMDFLDNGNVILVDRIITRSKDDDERVDQGPSRLAGTYTFLDEKTLEITAFWFRREKVTKSQIELTTDRLILTNDEGKIGKIAYERVKAYSAKLTNPAQKGVALTKQDDPKKSKEGTSPKVPTVPATLTFKKHEASVESVAFSPDGSLIASGGDDGVVIIWERATGKVKHKFNTLEDRNEFNRNEGVRSVAFSPDGSTVTSKGYFWEVETGEKRHFWDVEKGDKRFHGPGGKYVAFSPDGRKLITATYNKVHVWDLVEDKQVFSKDTPGQIMSIAVSHDGKLIASGDLNSYVRVWDAKTGEQTFSYKDSRAQIYSVAFSPDSAVLVAGSGNVYLTAFDLKTGEKTPTKRPEGAFYFPVFLPDGKHVAWNRRQDDSVRVWESSTGAERLILKGHTSPIKALAVSQDGKWLVSGSQDHTVKVWELSSVVGPAIKVATPSPDKDVFTKRDTLFKEQFRKRNPTKELYQLETDGYVSGVTFSPNGKYLAAGGEQTIVVWNSATKEKVRQTKTDSYFPHMCVAFCPDSTFMAFPVSGGMRVLNVDSGEEKEKVKGKRFAFRVSALPASFAVFSSTAFSPNRIWIAAGGYYYLKERDDKDDKKEKLDGKVIKMGIMALWDADTGEERLVLDRGALSESDGNRVAFSPDGKVLAYSHGSEIKFWDLIATKEERSFQHRYPVNCFAFSPTGKYLAVGTRNPKPSKERKDWGDLTIWNLPEKKGRRLDVAGMITDVSFSSDGLLASVGLGDGVSLWDTDTGRRITTLPGARCIAFHPKEPRLALDVSKAKTVVSVRQIDVEALEMLRVEVNKATVAPEIIVIGEKPIPPMGVDKKPFEEKKDDKKIEEKKP